MRAITQRGYTLVELVITVTIIAVVAAIAVPAFSTANDKEIQQIAAEFAAAMRFARTESLRTGKPHGFRFLTSEYRIRVYSADTSVNPWTWVFDIYHPISKQLYDYTFPEDLAGATPPVTHTPVYRGTCDRLEAVYFDANGTPWCLEPETVLLESYRLDVTVGTGQATVNLDGITGRVTVQ